MLINKTEPQKAFQPGSIDPPKHTCNAHIIWLLRRSKCYQHKLRDTWINMHMLHTCDQPHYANLINIRLFEAKLWHLFVMHGNERTACWASDPTAARACPWSGGSTHNGQWPIIIPNSPPGQHSSTNPPSSALTSRAGGLLVLLIQGPSPL